MDFVNVLIVLIPIILVFLVRFVINASPSSKEDIRKTQIELDKLSKFNKAKFGKEMCYDAEEELFFNRAVIKGFGLVSLGVLMAIAIFFVSRFMDLSSYSFSLVASSIFLVSYGLAFANRQKFAPIFFLLTLTLSLLLLTYYFHYSGSISFNLQNIKVSSFILIAGFIFFLLIPRIEKDEDEENEIEY